MGPHSSGRFPVRHRRGFTLIEMLFVLLVIGILATLVLPNYRRATILAKSADVVSRVNIINVALRGYEADNQIVPIGTGPVGQPPTYLVPYMSANQFAGPGTITFQLTKLDADAAPILLIAAGGDDAAPYILLSALKTLGPIAASTGSGIAISLSN